MQVAGVNHFANPDFYVNTALHPELFPEISAFALYVRLPIQFLFIAWAYWATRPETPAVAGPGASV